MKPPNDIITKISDTSTKSSRAVKLLCEIFEGIGELANSMHQNNIDVAEAITLQTNGAIQNIPNVYITRTSFKGPKRSYLILSN